MGRCSARSASWRWQVVKWNVLPKLVPRRLRALDTEMRDRVRNGDCLDIPGGDVVRAAAAHLGDAACCGVCEMRH